MRFLFASFVVLALAPSHVPAATEKFSSSMQGLDAVEPLPRSFPELLNIWLTRYEFSHVAVLPDKFGSAVFLGVLLGLAVLLVRTLPRASRYRHKARIQLSRAARAMSRIRRTIAAKPFDL